MKLIGLVFNKIEVEKTKDLVKQVKINSNIDVEEITQEKNIDLLKNIKDQEAVKFDFNFSVKYQPDFAHINFKGNILTILEKSESKTLFKAWKKKNIPDEIRIPLFNFILTKCNLKAFQFVDEFNLPPHIPLPKVRPKQDNQRDYTG